MFFEICTFFHNLILDILELAYCLENKKICELRARILKVRFTSKTGFKLTKDPDSEIIQAIPRNKYRSSFYNRTSRYFSILPNKLTDNFKEGDQKEINE